jgi:hypothetical protein
MELDRAPAVAEGGMGKAQIAEGIAFPPPVADLARDNERLLK